MIGHDKIYHKAFQAFLDLITPTVFGHLIILKDDPYFLIIFKVIIP